MQATKTPGLTKKEQGEFKRSGFQPSGNFSPVPQISCIDWLKDQPTLNEAMPRYAMAVQRGTKFLRDSEPDLRLGICTSNHREWLFSLPIQKDETGNLNYPVSGSGAAERGWVVCSNRHLNSFAESVIVNVGGCPETDVPSSREEKPGQRRRLHSSQRTGKPSTRRREPVRCETEAD